MAPKVTVLKVCISCDKCKVKLLKAIPGLEGVNKIETDEEKGTLTVTGSVDPHAVIKRARKAGTYAEIVSIGDPKKPEVKKVESEKEKPKCRTLEYCEKPLSTRQKPCGGFLTCQLIYVAVPFEIPATLNAEPPCTIM